MIAKKIVTKTNLLLKYRDIIHSTDTIRSLGRVVEVTGSLVTSHGPDVRLGEICYIEKVEDESYIRAEVIGFRSHSVLLSPLDNIQGVYPGSRVLSTGSPPMINLSDALLGRVIDGMGKPLDRKSKVFGGENRSLINEPPNPLERPLIEESLSVGVRSIDGLLTLGQGQRVGIFSGSGIGKSTLLGMMARYSNSDVNVIGLIGERGREVSEFIKNELGENGIKKSVIVVASSNESAMHRVRAAYLVTTIAEYFRDSGKNVLLLMDSLTRLAMAQREVGLAAGEPATTKGYPPSVFQMLPELLERAGQAPKGSITGLYTVLVESDDLNEPIADAVRGILDGHIILSRKLASKGHYPAIDVPSSISRSMPSVIETSHYESAMKIKEYLWLLQENEDIVQLGAYVKGSNPDLDKALTMQTAMNAYLRQAVAEKADFTHSVDSILKMAEST